MRNWGKYKPADFEYNGKWIKNWFSNMVISPIKIDGVWWPSIENYYQASKGIGKDHWKRFSEITPPEAKRMGRKLKLRKGWEEIKYDVMKFALTAKFIQPEWKSKLMATGNDVIIEWNNWGDKVWGVDIRDCEGQNLLGKALMEIRDKLKT